MGFGDSPRKTFSSAPLGKKHCDDPLIDYKEVVYLAKFLSSQAQIMSRRRTGFCAQCQRELKQAIKRARHVGLLPFVQ